MDHLRPAGQPGTLRHKTHSVIFLHDTPAGKAFDVGLILAILVSVAAVMAESVHSINDEYGTLLRAVEWVLTILFSIEYVLRLWCVRRPTRYARSFFGLVDLFAVLPTWVSVLLPGVQGLAVIRILRVVRVFRVLKLAQFVGEASLLGSAIRAARFKITVFIISVVSIVVIVGSIMYLVEGPAAGFTSIPRGVYWGIVTLTTVGYGDIAPITTFGQVLAAIVMILGYGIIAVPTGIFTAELALQAREGAARRPTRPCPACARTEGDPEASYCRYCGSALDAP